MLTYEIPGLTEPALQRLAHDVAFALRAGDVLALEGDLGAGKTTFARAAIAAFAAEAGSPPPEVPSPTFTLVHEYGGPGLAAYHFDFYRLDAAEEVINIGWDDYLDAGGVVIVEWADKFPELLPANARWFRFTMLPDGARGVEER